MSQIELITKFSSIYLVMDYMVISNIDSPIRISDAHIRLSLDILNNYDEDKLQVLNREINDRVMMLSKMLVGMNAYNVLAQYANLDGNKDFLSADLQQFLKWICQNILPLKE